ncbi:MAG: DUF4278 domain-containing protein [Xenococcaceae cyanobacterium]
MKLRFLGQAYSASNHQVETIASDCNACFLGQRYTIRRPIQTLKPQLGIKKYRGVFYGAE